MISMGSFRFPERLAGGKTASAINLISLTLTGFTRRAGTVFHSNDDGNRKVTAICAYVFDDKDAKKGRKFPE